MADASDGDRRRAELERLMEELRPRLERMVAVRMHARLASRMDPADVVQDAYAELIRKLAQPPDLEPELWLRLEVGERLTDLHRQHLGAQQRDLRREEPVFPEASSIAIASAFLDRGATPSQHGMARERAGLLRNAIDRMKPIDREVLALRHFEEATNQETAQILGLSEQAASVRYARALQRLRVLLDEADLGSSGAR